MLKSKEWENVPRELLNKQLNYTAFISFGKFALDYLNLENTPDKINWFRIFEKFMISNSTVKPGIAYINWVVSQKFKQDPIQVRENKTKEVILTLPRQVTVYLASKFFKYTTDEICDFYTLKPLRSYVSNTNRKIEDLRFGDKNIDFTIEEITKKLLGYKTK